MRRLASTQTAAQPAHLQPVVIPSAHPRLAAYLEGASARRRPALHHTGHHTGRGDAYACAESNRRPVEARDPCSPAGQRDGPGSLDGASPARPQNLLLGCRSPTLPYRPPQRATAPSCGLAGGDSRSPARSGGREPAGEERRLRPLPRSGGSGSGGLLALPCRCRLNMSRNPPSSPAPTLSPCPPLPPWCRSRARAGGTGGRRGLAPPPSSRAPSRSSFCCRGRGGLRAAATIAASTAHPPAVQVGGEVAEDPRRAVKVEGLRAAAAIASSTPWFF
ncbi:hypothetical protein PVAP13_1NG264338 [Panicum virgatum]|uniref:Uncharacterized protein n=1 Tax=Panicum virgatum TaxID=38727 RepID=A0A8T0WUU3_PANVG|nr:hypothetical protein PVAP13_1NG264338 [Panicum virgatum]